MDQHPATMAYRNFKNIAFEEGSVLIPTALFLLEFSAQAHFEEDGALVRLEDDLRLADLAVYPP
jgi:hypothetical protein